MADSLKRNEAAQEAIRSGANRTMAIIEKAFIDNASGRYVTLKVDKSGASPSTGAPPAGTKDRD